jgi:hypothetical protein
MSADAISMKGIRLAGAPLYLDMQACFQPTPAQTSWVTHTLLMFAGILVELDWRGATHLSAGWAAGDHAAGPPGAGRHAALLDGPVRQPALPDALLRLGDGRGRRDCPQAGAVQQLEGLGHHAMESIRVCARGGNPHFLVTP